MEKFLYFRAVIYFDEMDVTAQQLGKCAQFWEVAYYFPSHKVNGNVAVQLIFWCSWAEEL